MDWKELNNMDKAAADIIKLIPTIVAIHSAYYKELVDQGFTPDQATYLVAAHGTSLGMKNQEK